MLPQIPRLCWVLLITSCAVSAQNGQMHIVNGLDSHATASKQSSSAYITRFTEREAAPFTDQFLQFLIGKRRRIGNFFRGVFDSMLDAPEAPRHSFLYLRTLEDTTFQEIRVGLDGSSSDNYEVFHAKSTQGSHDTIPQLQNPKDLAVGYMADQTPDNVNLRSILKAVEDAWWSQPESQRDTYATHVIKWVDEHDFSDVLI